MRSSLHPTPHLELTTDFNEVGSKLFEHASTKGHRIQLRGEDNDIRVVSLELRHNRQAEQQTKKQHHNMKHKRRQSASATSSQQRAQSQKDGGREPAMLFDIAGVALPTASSILSLQYQLRRP